MKTSRIDPIHGSGLLEARGKFLFLGSEKLYLKGLRVTDQTEKSWDLLALGVNVVWLKAPTPDRLDAFARQGVGVVAQFEVDASLANAFSGNARATEEFRDHLLGQIEQIRNHSALFAYDLGGPVSEPVRRWLGDRKLEHELFLAFRSVKGLDHKHLVTYTNHPSLAHLDLAFLDFLTFQLDGRSHERLPTGLVRLQNITGARPLVVSYLPGPDSHRPDQTQDAHDLDQQLRMSFNAGCAGVVVSRPRGSSERDTEPLPVLDEGDPSQSPSVPAPGPRIWSGSIGASSEPEMMPNEGTRTWYEMVHTAFAELPFPPYYVYPRISVVICTYNGEETIEECLDGVSRIDYPDFEVIIVDDASRDDTATLAETKAKTHGFRVIRLTPNRGLSTARNEGMAAASGEIIAFLDQDAFPDSHWLRYLALTFAGSRHAVIGGPNLNPRFEAPTVDCIDHAPGNPQIVMADDGVADHIPGCNLAVRRSFMKAIGGFDPRYRCGGDDVDFCWRVLKLGGTLGPSPGAMVWHHRRQGIRSFLRQQMGYGKGEATLERDWPERFNSLGHQVRSGLSNDAGGADVSFFRSRIYQDRSCETSFSRQLLWLFPTMPEYPLILGLLGMLSAIAWVSKPFLVFLPLFSFGACAWAARALHAGLSAHLKQASVVSRAVVSLLFLLQPAARLCGRLTAGLTPWHCRCAKGFALPYPRVLCFSCEDRLDHDDARRMLGRAFRGHHLPLVRGGSEFEWDWQIDGGLFGGVRCLTNVTGTEISTRAWPYVGTASWALLALFVSAIAAAGADGVGPLALGFAIPIGIVALLVLRQTGGAMAALLTAVRDDSSRRSVWDTFQPASHTFEMPSPPEDGTILR